MKRQWQRDVNTQLSLRNGCMHTAFSLPCWVCCLSLWEGFCVFQFAVCSCAEKQLQGRKVLYAHTEKKKKSPLILICQLQFRIIKACISGRDSVAWQNLLAPCWDQLNSGRLSSTALGKQKPGHCHGEQKPSSEGGKIYDLKWF